MALRSQKGLSDFIRGENKRVVLIRPKRGKYFRIVADIEVNGVSAAQHMLHEGLARKYTTKKVPWVCNEGG